MQDVIDAELEMMSVKELQDLRDSVDEAIRTAIRQARPELKAATAPPKMIDLERERDAWKARSVINGVRSKF